MDLDSLPKNASSLKFSKHNAHIMSLCLTIHVNLLLSLRKTAQALNDLSGIRISHQQVANCARTAAIVIKPFVDHYKYPKSSLFTADGSSAYPLAFTQKLAESFHLDFTQVIGLTNDDAVSKEFRPYKQMIEHLNRTFKSTYRVSCGYDNYNGANYSVAFWVSYYNFLRLHSHNHYQVLNKVDMLEGADNMPGK